MFIDLVCVALCCIFIQIKIKDMLTRSIDKPSLQVQDKGVTICLS